MSQKRMVDSKLDLTQWQPRTLIHAARHQGLTDFVSGCESHFFLIVMLQAGDSELSFGLNAGERSEGDGLAFRTATRDLGATMAGDVAQGRFAVGSGRLVTQPSAEPLPSALSRASCYVVPICKRSEVSFLHQVSVGRARNHDIVLRHRTVSKFHAWFDVTPDARLFVKDCDSSNHTFVNGERVRDKAEVHATDAVRFGSVEARVCSGEGLWQLVRS